MADGSVIIGVNLDTKKADKELAKLKKEIESTEGAIGEQEAKKSPLTAQAERLNQEMKQARAEVQKFGKQWASGVAGADVQQAKAQERLNQISAEYDGVVRQIDKIDEKLLPAYEKLDRMKEEAGGLQQNIDKAAKNTKKMDKATQKAEKRMGVFTTRLRGILLSAFVFNILSAGFRQLTEWMGKVIKSNDEARSAIAKLKGALLTLAQPLVDVVLPAFTNLVNLLTKIASVLAAVISALFGTTAKKSAEAAENLYDEMNAIEGVGDAAKEASVSLAGFDEINKLTSEHAESSSIDSDIIVPDFSALSGGLIGKLAFSLSDILFEWKDLTAEDILAKIVTALGAIAGGIIGFTIGGPGGAAIGILVGAGLGLALANALFNGGGKIDTEELLKTLVTTLGTLAGAVIGFTLGGVGGAAIGAVVGAGISLSVAKALFNGDGKMDNEEILKSIVTALTSIAGTVIGFMIGGPVGGAIGLLVTSSITVSILGGIFNGDGTIQENELLEMIKDALIILAGGVIGFVVGGPAGALIGIAVGAGVVLTISSLDAKGGKAANIANTILKALTDALFIVCGGIIGFTVGGPAGAVIGMIIAAGITFTIDNKNIAFSGGTKGAVRGAGRDIVLGVEKGAEDEMSTVGQWMKNQIVNPFVEDFKALFGIHSPSTVMAKLGENIMLGLKNGAESIRGSAVDPFKLFKDGVLDVFNGLWMGMKSPINNIIGGIEWMANKVVDGINTVIKSMNRVKFTMPSWLGGGSFGFNIKTLSKVSLPRLAEGAVIPPNREFMAILGDQKSGTNIEAPLETIVQAFRIAMQDSGGTTTVIVTLDGKEVARNQVKHINDMTRQAGKPVLLY